MLAMAEWTNPGLDEENQVKHQLQFLNNALTLGEATGAQDTLLKIHRQFLQNI